MAASSPPTSTCGRSIVSGPGGATGRCSAATPAPTAIRRRPEQTFDLSRRAPRRTACAARARRPSTMAPCPLAPTPDLAGFRELARDRRVIPVTRRLLADGETPLSVYRKLAGGRPGTFLLESAELGGVWSRYSLRRRAVARHADRARRAGALARRAAGRRADRRRPARRAAGDRRGAAHRAAAGAAAADRRAGGRHRLRRRAPARAAARPHHRRPARARDRDDAGHRPGRPRPRRRLGAAHRQRHQLRRHRRAGRLGVRTTPSSGSTG